MPSQHLSTFHFLYSVNISYLSESEFWFMKYEFMNQNYATYGHMIVTSFISHIREYTFLKNAVIFSSALFYLISITHPLTSPVLTSSLISVCPLSVAPPIPILNTHWEFIHPSLIPSSTLPVIAGCPQWVVVRANQLLVGGGGDGIGRLNNPADPVSLALPQSWDRDEVNRQTAQSDCCQWRTYRSAKSVGWIRPQLQVPPVIC